MRSDSILVRKANEQLFQSLAIGVKGKRYTAEAQLHGGGILWILVSLLKGEKLLLFEFL